MGRLRSVAKGFGAVLIPPLLTFGILTAIHLAGRHDTRTGTAASPVASTGAAAAAPACPWRVALIGTVAASTVRARVAPSATAPVVATFGRRNVQGNPQVFLLFDARIVRKQTWFRALLPVRPNGTTGFIPGSRLKL